MRNRIAGKGLRRRARSQIAVLAAVLLVCGLLSPTAAWAVAPNISIGDASLSEGNSGTANATFEVNRSGDTSAASSVKFQTVNDTALAGQDYVAESISTLNFAPGETTKVILIGVKGDTDVETNETFSVVISDPTNGVITISFGTGTILNDDVNSAISVGDVSISEGDSGNKLATFVIHRTNTQGFASVGYQTVNQSASQGSDYVALSFTKTTFGPGVSDKPVNVTIKGDVAFEPNETFLLLLSAPVNATISDDLATGIITNDDVPASISVAGPDPYDEGNSFTKRATFVITRTGDTTVTSSVDYQTVDSSAVAPDDYTAKPLTTLTFTPGQTSKTVSVTTKTDTAPEGDESFFLQLSNVVGANLGTSIDSATLLNDDAAPSFSINDVSVTEGNFGSKSASFKIVRSGDPEPEVSVKYKTTNGSASEPGDYEKVDLTVLTFASGQTSKTVTVKVKGDTDVEPDETFNVVLSAAVGASITDGTGKGTIVNND